MRTAPSSDSAGVSDRVPFVGRVVLAVKCGGKDAAARALISRDTPASVMHEWLCVRLQTCDM